MIKKNKMTIDKLAGMVQNGFADVRNEMAELSQDLKKEFKTGLKELRDDLGAKINNNAQRL